MTWFIFIITGLFFLITLIGIILAVNDKRHVSKHGLNSTFHTFRNHTSKAYRVRAWIGGGILLFFYSVFWIAKALQLFQNIYFLLKKYKTKSVAGISSLLGNGERNLFIFLPFVVVLYGYFVLNDIVEMSVIYLVLAGIYSYIIAYIIHPHNIFQYFGNKMSSK